MAPKIIECPNFKAKGTAFVLTAQTTAMKGKLLSILALLLLLSGCHGARYHYTQGNKYAEARSLKNAVTEYKQALDRKPGKVKYVLAMENYGNALLEELYTNYRFADGNDSLSVYRFLEAEKWTTYLGRYMSTDRYNGFYDQDYQAQKSRYMERVYDRSKRLIRAKNYEKAKVRLEELASLDKAYKDVQALLRFSEVEPIYTKALALFEQGHYRETYGVLADMISKYPEQEELIKLQQEALTRGKYYLGIVADPRLTGSEASMSAAVQSRLIRELHQKSDPFLELLDRTNFDLLQDEQQAIIEGKTTDEALTQELLVANAYAKLVITLVDENKGKLRSERKKGYERYYVSSKNAEGKTVKTAKYRKVYYTEYWKENSAHYTAELTLTDRATSKILEVESFDFSRSSSVNYIDYGNDQLFPGNWKYQNRAHSSDRPQLSESRRRTLAQMRKASHSPKSTAAMRKEAVAEFAVDAAKSIHALELTP